MLLDAVPPQVPPSETNSQTPNHWLYDALKPLSFNVGKEWCTARLPLGTTTMPMGTCAEAHPRRLAASRDTGVPYFNNELLIRGYYRDLLS